MDVDHVLRTSLAGAPAPSLPSRRGCRRPDGTPGPPLRHSEAQKAVLVNRRGGAWVGDLHVDMPLIELEVYGPTKTEAHTLANAARQALLALIGRHLGGNVVTDVEEQDGPRWLPDYLYQAANRYVSVAKFSLDVY